MRKSAIRESPTPFGRFPPCTFSFSKRNSFLFLTPVVRQRMPILFRGQRKNVFVNLQGQVRERFDKKSSSHKIERIFCQNLASCQITSFEAALETKSAYSGSLNALKKMSETIGEEIFCYGLVFWKQNSTSSHYRIKNSFVLYLSLESSLKS